MDRSKQPGLQIVQVLLLSAQFSHRPDALALPPNTVIEQSPVLIEAKVTGRPGDTSVAVRLRVYTPPDRKDLLYAFDIEIAAIVASVAGEENLDPIEYARQMGPAAFYPFLREAVASITMKGRFGPVWLRPLNFVALQEAATAEV